MGLSPGEAKDQLPGQTAQSFEANVVDQYGMPMQGVLVTFSTDFGSIAGATQVSTDSLGRAGVTVSSTTDGTAHVTATAGAVSALSTVTWLPEPRIPAVTLIPDTATNQLPDATSQILTATVVDQHNTPIKGIQVTFATDFGSIVGDSMVTTDSLGMAAVTVSSSADGTAHVTATVDGALKIPTSTITWLAAQVQAPAPFTDPTIDPTPDPTPDPVPEPATEQG